MASIPPPTQYPAGWYESPNRTNARQYWDGHEWSNDYAPLTAPEPEQSGGGMVVVGYVTAVLMPLIGFILGIVVATRPNKAVNKHGALIIVVSILAFIVYLVLITKSASTTSSTYSY